MVLGEAQLVSNRLAGVEAGRAAMLNLAVGALLSKEGGKSFKETLDRMTGEANG